MQKVDLEFLAHQLDRLINDLADLKDGMAVLMARLERLEATSAGCWPKVGYAQPLERSAVGWS
jgi:hypothetical protein